MKRLSGIDLYVVIAVIAAVLILVLVPRHDLYEENMTIREPAVAGTWYAASENTLRQQIDIYLENSQKIDVDGKIKAIIVPHAGLVYSGQTAAAAFTNIEEDYENVFVLAPSHKYPLEGISIMNVTHYKTPIGLIELSDKAAEIRKLTGSVEEAHTKEHSIEIELPFLQRKINDLKIIPMLIGRTDANNVKQIIKNNLGEDDLIVVSVDLSHYHNYDDALKLDEFSINKILDLDDYGIFDAEIDAPWAVSSLLKLANEKEWKPILLSYSNSGDITGDKSRVVGYAAIAFVEKEELKIDEKNLLLNLARTTIESFVNEGEIFDPEKNDLNKVLKQKRAAFVSLEKNGLLRGSIGHLLPVEPLYLSVRNNAIAAVSKDSRFQPVSPDELSDIKITVSVLSIPELVEVESFEEYYEKIEKNRHGVILRKGLKRATYLPQVWEQLPDHNKFFSRLCIKANLEEDCWKDKNTKVYSYEAEVFKE